MNTHVIRMNHGVTIHNNKLYGFAQSQQTHPVPLAIIGSSDGDNWQTIYTSSFTSLLNNVFPPSYQGSISYDGYLYAAFDDGQVMRTSGNENPLQWQSITPLPVGTVSAGQISLGTFNGYLHAAVVVGRSPDPTKTTVYRTKTGDAWELVGSFPTEPTILPDDLKNLDKAPRFAVYNGKLYLGTNFLWSTAGDTVPYNWIKDDTFSQGLKWPFVLFG